jgi:hypothetical protein
MTKLEPINTEEPKSKTQVEPNSTKAVNQNQSSANSTKTEAKLYKIKPHGTKGVKVAKQDRTDSNLS